MFSTSWYTCLCVPDMIERAMQAAAKVPSRTLPPAASTNKTMALRQSGCCFFCCRETKVLILASLMVDGTSPCRPLPTKCRTDTKKALS